MKERPILMNGAMVRATLAGIKSQTRRIVKPQPKMYEPGQDVGLSDYVSDMLVCPYGRMGDHLWVRETFFAYGRWETRFSEKKARDEWHFIDMTAECDRAYQYDADAPAVPLARGRGGTLPGWYRRPAIFMPRAASRIRLRITGARAERLNNITLGDICKEGLARSIYDFRPATDGFRVWKELWESINGAGSYDANPWVWVVELKQVTP